MNRIISVFASFVIILLITTWFAPKVINWAANEYFNSRGVTASAEGTITEKRHTDAHYEYDRSLFFSSSKYYPEEWSVDIKRYNLQKQKWEHASLDVDKADYDTLSAGDYYKSKNVQTVYFWFDDTNN
jgi:hypothetical protein